MTADLGLSKYKVNMPSLISLRKVNGQQSGCNGDFFYKNWVNAGCVIGTFLQPVNTLYSKCRHSLKPNISMY